jgi:hypothetical protein
MILVSLYFEMPVVFTPNVLLQDIYDGQLYMILARVSAGFFSIGRTLLPITTDFRG